MRRGLFILVLSVVVVSFCSAARGQNPVLEGSMSARKIVVSENRETAVPADKVYPRDTVEYMLKYRNSGDSPARGVELTGPVPPGTVYIEQTATEQGDYHPLFSIDDGKTYQEAPVTYTVTTADGRKVKKRATPDMITHIRWNLPGELKVDQEVTLSYRVRVK